LDVLVKIPDVKGKITRKKKGNSIYINYEYGRVYDTERKFNIPQRATIGKLSKDDATMMQPNQNYRIYFQGEAMPVTKAGQGQSRSSCLQVGTHIVIEKLMKDLKIKEFLERHMDPKDAGTPIINYSIAYDTLNRTPLFYEEYPGSIVDVSQLIYMIDKAKAYGYKNMGFILDRGTCRVS
jgi:hypothetical protein